MLLSQPSRLASSISIPVQRRLRQRRLPLGALRTDSLAVADRAAGHTRRARESARFGQRSQKRRIPVGRPAWRNIVRRGDLSRAIRELEKERREGSSEPGNVSKRCAVEGIRSTRRLHATAQSFNCRLFPGRQNGKRNILRARRNRPRLDPPPAGCKLFANSSLSQLERVREIPSSQPGFCPPAERLKLSSQSPTRGNRRAPRSRRMPPAMRQTQLTQRQRARGSQLTTAIA